MILCRRSVFVSCLTLEGQSCLRRCGDAISLAPVDVCLSIFDDRVDQQRLPPLGVTREKCARVCVGMCVCVCRPPKCSCV